jgi:hypothetical protein
MEKLLAKGGSNNVIAITVVVRSWHHFHDVIVGKSTE